MGKFIMNGVEYTSSPMNGFPPLIYSDEEREVGVWRDGKPLYQKTINVPASTITGNETTINHGISNVDMMYFADGCIVRGGNLTLPLVTYHTVSSWASSIFNLTRTNFILYLGNDELSRALNVYVTLRYTKTTDTPGSGMYTTYGGLAHHYFTTEHIIGTWIDGKPLYEKTISVSNSERIDNNYVYAHGISNIETSMVAFAFVYNSSDNSSIPMPVMSDTDTGLSVRINNQNLFFRGTNYFAANANRTLYVVVQYTKTTD